MVADVRESRLPWPCVSTVICLTSDDTKAQHREFVARLQRVGITKRQRVKRTEVRRERRTVEELPQLQYHKVQPIRRRGGRRSEPRRLEHARRGEEHSPTNPVHLATLCACTVVRPEADRDAVHGRVQQVPDVFLDAVPHVRA